MSTSRPGGIVAPSFSQNDDIVRDQFAGMEEDFNDEDQFEDFSMDQDYGIADTFEQESAVKNDIPGTPNNNVASVVPQTSKTSTSGWSTIKFNTDDLQGISNVEEKSVNPKNQFQNQFQGSLGDEFDETKYDYPAFNQGYDDMVTNEVDIQHKDNSYNRGPEFKDHLESNQLELNRNFNNSQYPAVGADPNVENPSGYKTKGYDKSEKKTLSDFYNEESDKQAQSIEGLADEVDDEGQEENEDAGEGEEDEEYEDDAESEGDNSEDVSDDEDINEALNSLGDLDAEMAMEDDEEQEENAEVPASEPGPSDAPAEGEGEKVQKKKRKRKKKGEGSEQDEEGKQKRKRKKKGEKGEDDEKKKKGDKNARKNIRKILSENKLEQETLDAQNAELERQRRLQELKKQQLAALLAVENEPKKEKDSQLKSLLQAAEEEAEKETEKPKIKEEKITTEEKKEGKTKKDGIIDISSGEDDDDVVMVPDEEEDDGEMSDEDLAEAEDVNNSGSHINDMYNVPDDQGRVLVNVGHPTADPDIYLSPLVAKHIKPHQIGGVRFLYDNLVECLNRFKTSSGFGCILAHSMGLGKTIQMIGFTDIFLRCTGAKSVLVIVPINTLANWMAEFNMWVPDKETCEKYNIPEEDSSPRPYEVFLLNDNYKNTPARAKVVESWHKNGGVLLIGYEMYRLLSSKKVHLQKSKGRKKPGSDVIDVEEEDRDKKLLLNIHEALVNPGPDLVVCDEGHRIKNSHAGISQSLKQIKTKRRIVLTGYPLQNNLIEYWCMVDFVRPNFLGTKTEFCNMFERPIMNGQCADSTPQDVRLMRYRAHVLHSLLEGFVQRRGHTVLQAALPPKEEYVFLIRMSPVQKTLYEKFMESVTETGSNGWVNNNPLKAFSVCCKIWNHPDILYTCMKKSLDDNDLDIETGEQKKKGGRSKSKKETPPATPNPPTPVPPSPAPDPGAAGTPTPGIPSVAVAAAATGAPGTPSQGPTPNVGRQSEPSVTYDWANEILKDYTPGCLENGGKMLMLFNLITHSLQAGDKILVFSQSLFTLNLIEEFLSKYKVPRPEMDEFWCKNKNYFRLDGSTSSSDREKMINQFNAESNKWLFLLSTRAGSLGINLVGANRVVVVDASWNPCHDCQAICRVYRFGQIKPSYIYRLVTENTMERKIYDRQVNKQGMSDRVVDELNPQNQFRRGDVDKLMSYENKEFGEVDFSDAEEEFTDYAMITLLKNEGHWLTAKPFTHESLLIDRKELKLTMKEKRLAKQSYVMEKRLNVSYSRPSYAAYYPRSGASPYQGAIRGRGGMIQRPVASVKPMVSTPVPMRPKIVAAPQILKPGVSVHQVLTTTEIVLPGTNTTTEAGTSEPKKIPSGQQVLVIRTPKGVYIRTPDGKIFAVRSKPQADSTSPLDTLANTGRNLSSGGVTIVRPTTTATTSSGTALKTSTGVTVIRPTIVSTKSLTIIRQGPGQVRTIIPVAVGSKASTSTSTTVGQLSKIATQTQKVNKVIQGSPKIRVVTPTASSLGTSMGTNVSAATAAALGDKSIIANSPAFGGGTTIIRKVDPKGLAEGSKKVSVSVSSAGAESSSTAAMKEFKSEESSNSSSVSSETESEKAKKDSSDSSWNLPPIDMKAIKLPQKIDSAVGNSSVGKVKKTSTKAKGKRTPKAMGMKLNNAGGFTNMGSNTNVPKFSLAESSSDSNLSTEIQSPRVNTPEQPLPSNRPPPQQAVVSASHFSSRPSDIDLHEMKLTENTFSSSSLSEMDSNNSDLMRQGSYQSPWQSNAGNNYQTGAPQTESRAPLPQRSQDTLNSRPNQGTGFFNPGLPDNMAVSEQSSQPVSQASNMINQTKNQRQMYNSNNQMYHGNNMPNMFGNFNTPSYGGFQNANSMKQNMGFGNQSSGFDNTTPKTSSYTSQQSHPNNDNMADFTMTGIHNNSSFLSELTDADDNFLSQLGGENSNQSSQSNSMDSSQNNISTTSAGNLGSNAGAGSQSGNMGSQYGNMGMQSSYQQPQQSGGMNFDMFSQPQQNQGFFPNFNSNQFNRSSNFGSQQNMNMPQQGGFPGGNMYPMGGMMQPGMFPYPAFAPYPYPPMMAPMPYYPMPFQPQYGAQGPNMGQQGGSMGQPGGNIGMPMGQQGDGGFHSGMGN